MKIITYKKETDMDIKRLKTGVAYYGNRMLSHAISDMKDIARSDMDIVVHMLTHNDIERSFNVMKDIFRRPRQRDLKSGSITGASAVLPEIRDTSFLITPRRTPITATELCTPIRYALTPPRTASL